MRRLLWVVAILAAALTIAPSASAFPNGRAKQSELAPIFMPHNLAYLAKSPPAAAAWNTMRLCSIRDGVDLYPTASSTVPARTAYRSYAQQVALYAAYRAGRGSLAAIPGHSNHGLARAVDLATPTMRAWVDHHGEHWGWGKHGDAPSEWWHVTYDGRGEHRPNPGTSLRYPQLRRGSGGPCQAAAVKEVERRLGLPQDGRYGRATAKAVRVFQKQHGLRRTGIVASGTWVRLRSAQRHEPATVIEKKPRHAAPTGVDVRAAQGLLNARLVELHRAKYRVRVTGVLDPPTVIALKRFQRLRHIPRTGKLDDRTYQMLLRAVAPPLVGKVFGPDVSEANGSINWQLLRKAGGAQFVIVKTSEGGDYRDHLYGRARVRAIRAAHFPLGFAVYHYVHPIPGRTGDVEARFALRVALAGGWRPSDGPLWEDLETTRLGPLATCAYSRQFESYLIARHVPTGVYTYPGFAHQYLGRCGSFLTRRASWRANYGVSQPDPFPWRGYALWQNTDHAQIRGAGRPVDLSVGQARVVAALAR